MANANDPLIGRVLDGRYRVGARIARGGMAVVHEATDLRLDRTVAVKVMHAGLADDGEFVARFEREARSAARLAHHNVVAVFDQGDDEGTLFLVMEYVPGITLRDLIRKDAPMPPARALALLDPVLRALSAAHHAGMIHRDVKPENVLLPDDGGPDGVKVADFGLARAINAETQHTATGGVLIGTVSYLAPELVTSGRADARADVYAAGVLLYEMLTGAKPHQADSPIQVAYKHVHEDIPPPSAAVPGIPTYVDALVARATARDPSQRPADAGVMLHQLRRVRQALDHGVTDDPELTADLAPLRHGPDATDEIPLPDVEATSHLPSRIIDPSTPGGADDMFKVADAFGPSATGAPATVAVRPPADPVPVTGRVVAHPGPPYRPRRRRRGPLLLAVLLVLVLLVGLGTWYFGIARYTVTPGVIDLSQSAASAKLQKAGLRMTVSGREYSETVARGAVTSTSPDAGERILKHGTVSVVISRGPERHKVPRVRGMTLDRAQAAIQDSKLAFGRALMQYNEKVPQGQVIRSDPAAGTELRRDTAVDVVVSKGPKPITIPDFTGRSATKAKNRLSDLGFKVSDTSQFSDSVPAGKVVSQSPASGTGHRGDAIELVVSKGPELVTVPSLQGKSYDDAAATLESLGLQPRRRESPFYIGLNRVAHVSPSPGARVRKGSVVTLDLV
ncbi:Stk1 family PASTA domain-containing Ser/Thr kinase [Nocardioides terrisoli]|uniref:Stk1 family PASTA domain-containing Ser/Thr kinase n=1 Tax=Nocardioides terrisoli TaxID=3388267 RepID=UPI00287B5F35|nr:Stk1 family PASTA domain-containing Ser/Thr kinase [Nocardioides marmorisolisilvae]